MRRNAGAAAAFGCVTCKLGIMSSGRCVLRMPTRDGHIYHIQWEDLRPAFISSRASSNEGQRELTSCQRPDWHVRMRWSTGLVDGATGAALPAAGGAAAVPFEDFEELDLRTQQFMGPLAPRIR